jgi:hypothetical protein
MFLSPFVYSLKKLLAERCLLRLRCFTPAVPLVQVLAADGADALAAGGAQRLHGMREHYLVSQHLVKVAKLAVKRKHFDFVVGLVRLGVLNELSFTIQSHGLGEWNKAA